ncbi:MAG: Y4yA family PLP-dependent enzyme [Polaromonas sp.]|uniref:Y4yA family PLP-dependent enzyme n=1 Tax=Polaromonas sp. TaxID=1869339 RepID=UPI003264045F
MQSKLLFAQAGVAHRTHVPERLAQPLKPVLEATIARLIEEKPAFLAEMVAQYGSPLHLVWPDNLTRNVEAFRAVLNAHGLRHLIFYGAKVNKSQALVCAAVGAGAGVDVSSIHEWRDAVSAGADPRNLCATGPAKTRAFHAELVAGNALISIDSAEELQGLRACLRESEHSQKARVLLRYRPALSRASRFGMGPDELLHCLRQLSQDGARLAFEGFHFHLGGYAHETRAQALRELIPHVEAARALGLKPQIIDIGGGMPIQYVDSDDYEAFLHAQNSSHYRNARVPDAFYPYGGRLDACQWLDRFLEAPSRGGLSIAGYLKAEDLTLAIEPGRSLADQAAISVFRVTRVKPLADGHVIFVEGSSFSACETWFTSEFLQDPILVPVSAAAAVDETANPPSFFRAYIAGHSCLDDDVLTNRLISFNRIPRAGDLLVYGNTGGYQMDLLENEFHRHPMPRRVAVHCNAAGGFDVSPDDPREQLDDIEQSD